VILLLAAVSGATAILHTQQCPGQIGNSVCANFSVPLDWSDQNSGENIDVFATIFGSGNGGNNLDDIDGVVWALNFGCDGWLVNTAFDWMQALSNEKNYVIIWPNMRGDGLSTPRLECSDDPDGIADPPSIACADEWQGNSSFLRHFSLDNAVEDLHSMAQVTRPDLPHYLVGVGHGSLWAQRVQAKYPKMFVRSIFAGYTNPMAFDFFASLTSREAAVRQVLSECEADATCAAQLGGGANVQATLSRVLQLAEMDILPCNRQLAGQFAPRHNESWRHVYSQMIAGLVGATSPFLQPMNPDAAVFVLPLLYRLQRCDESNHNDVSVLTALFQKIKQQQPTPNKPETVCKPSAVLRANVLLNELVRNDPAETAQYVMQATAISADVDYVNDWYTFYAAYPTYKKPSANSNDQGKWYPSQNNNGGTTMQAKFASTLGTDLSFPTARSSVLYDSAPNTTYVALNNIGANMLGHNAKCVLSSMQSWFVTNTSLAELDPCVNDTNPLDLLCNQQQTQGVRSDYFGNAKPWDFSLPSGGTFVIPDVPFTTLAPPTTIPPNTTTAAPTQNPNATHGGGPSDSSNTGAIVGAIFGVIAVMAIGILVYCKCVKGSGDAGGGSNFGGGYNAGGGSGYNYQPAPAGGGFGGGGGGNVQYGGNAGGGGGGWNSGGGGGLYN
jgi:hypothetical protein